MKKFFGGIAATIVLGGFALLISSADCTTGGNCYLANGDLFIKVATALQSLSSEDPLRWTRR